MPLKVSRTNLWCADIEDEAAGLSECLEALANAGANLECVIARRHDERTGKGLVFVGPLMGRRVMAAAEKVGFNSDRPIAALKIEGTDMPALGAMIAQAIGFTGISMRGISAMAYGRKVICYAAFDRPADADTAAKAITRIAKPRLRR